MALVNRLFEILEIAFVRFLEIAPRGFSTFFLLGLFILYAFFNKLLYSPIFVIVLKYYQTLALVFQNPIYLGVRFNNAFCR